MKGLHLQKIRKEVKDMKKRIITQEEAQAIIKKEYGKKAYAIGHGCTEKEVTIFWLYEGENEDNYRTHTEII